MKKIYETESDMFTGYYDKDILRNDLLLVCKTNFVDKMPSFGDELAIGTVNIRDGSFTYIDSTKAWNWQQSCQLTFLNDETIAFNKFSGDKVILNVVNITDGSKRQYEHPSMGYSMDGRKYIATNVEVLSYFRPSYGYKYSKDIDKNQKDYIYLVDLESGKKESLIDEKDIIALIKPSIEDTITFEHCMFSPDSKKLMILLRTRGGRSSKSLLVSVNVDTREIVYHQNLSRISHCCWLGNNFILGFGNMKKSVSSGGIYKIANKVLSPYIKDKIKGLLGKKEHQPMPFVGDEYFLWNVDNNNIEKFNAFDSKEDGHPFSLVTKTDTLITTDTYPNPETGIASLFSCKLDKYHKVLGKSRVDIKTDHTFSRTGYRCDLHPKISKDAKHIIIDKVSERKRTVEVYEV